MSNTELKKPKKVVVKRSHWLRGGKDPQGNNKKPTLCNSKDNMCCLGFMGLEFGYSKGTIYHKPDPFSLSKKGRRLSGKWKVMPISFYSNAILINDNKQISAKERERQLRKLFNEHGIKLVIK